jgi:hypothetical protein
VFLFLEIYLFWDFLFFSTFLAPSNAPKRSELELEWTPALDGDRWGNQD